MEVTAEEAVADPTQISTPQQLAGALSLLRERAALTVRDVQKRTGIAASTLGGYFSGRHRPPVDALAQILAACGVTDPDDVASWTDALLRVRRTARRRVPPCPYRGLEPFGPEHHEWYFGRSALVEAVTREVVECAAAGHPLVVVGPSGCGKSSLLGAGVVPALAQDHGMRSVILTPGGDPLGELDAQLGADGTDGPVPAVLVVDQFEEVLAPGVPAAARTAFVAALRTAAGRMAVVIGLRADFYADALRLPELAASVQTAQVPIGPMTPKDLREVITKPAERVGVEIEDGLVDLLLEDLDPGEDSSARSVGVLPLLSHALLSTWQRSHGTRMTLADYRATGGVRGAISRSAEDAVARLGPEREEIVRQLFLRLVHVAPGVADTRRRVERAELLDGADAAAAEALDRFVQHRLLVVDGDCVQIAHEALLAAWPRLQSWVDADRAGIAAQRQLSEAARQWRDHDEDPDALLRGTRLAAAAERFHQRAHTADLNALERRYLQASEAQEAQRAAAGKRQTRRLRRLLATVSALFLVAAGLGVHTLDQRNDIAGERDDAVSRQLAVRSDSLRSADPALAAQLAVAAYRISPTPQARSSLLDSTAVPVPTRMTGPTAITQRLAVGAGLLVSATGSLPTAQVWRLDGPGAPRLVGDTAATTAPIQAVALSPDARTAAAGSSDGRIVLLDVADPARPPVAVRAGGGNVLALTFTPDGTTLVAGTADGLHAWTLAGAAPPVEIPPLAHPPGAVHAVAVSPDGRLLAAGAADGTTSVLALPGTTAAPVARLPASGGTVFAVAFGPRGRTLAVAGDDRTVRLWDVADPARPQAGATLAGPTNWINTLAFSPDGATIAGGSSDGHAWLWEPATGRVRAQLPHPTPVTSAAFVDAETLATGAADGTTRLWPVHGPVLTGFDDAVFALDFDRTGETLAIGPGKKDNAAHLWDASHPDGPRPLGPPAANPPGEPAVSGSAARTPDGRTLAVGRVDGSVRLWDTGDAARPSPTGPPLVGSTALVEQLAISADGRLLAVSGDDNTVRLWDLGAPGAARPLATLTGATSYVLASAFSPDGRLLAAASADTTTYLWNLDQPDHPRLISTLSGPTSYAYSPAFSPDGHLLAVGSADRTVRLWDVTDPARPVALGSPLVGPGNYVYAVAFAPDGTTLAAASTDGTVWLWDVTDPVSPRHLATLTGPTDAVFSVAWSPDGRELAAGSADRTVRLWRTSPEEASALLCARVGPPMTEDEWARFEPGGNYRPPCR